jgi:hypothetical protein
MTRFATAAFKRNVNFKAALAFLALLCPAYSVRALPQEAHADTHRAINGVIHHASQSSCQPKEKAEVEARDLAIKSAKTYCRSEGFGWRASKVKNLGNLDCHRCDDSRFKCAYLGVTLECRKAEPQLSSLMGWILALR